MTQIKKVLYVAKTHSLPGLEREVDDMLEFSARHSIAPITETFPISRVNEALEHLRAGKARYRIVLVNALP